MSQALQHRAKLGVALARRVLRGGPLALTEREPAIVARLDAAAPVALLAALSPEGDCVAVIPLASGRNIVGRQEPTAQHDWRSLPSPLVEAGQWVIRCGDDRTAEVADAWSTNGSHLIPNAALPEWPDDRPPREPDAIRNPLAIPLVHPAYNQQKLALRPLAEGDLLAGIYCAFVFGWL